MSKHFFRPAFTIVELLIVIVVIVILASIVIVSYSNVQDNAKQAKTATAFNTFQQMLQTYKSSNGYYPATQTLNNDGAVASNIGSSSNGYVCLGSNFQADPPFALNQCIVSTGNPSINASTNSTINTALRTINNTLPDSNGATVIGTDSSYGTLSVRGVIYTSQKRRDGTSQNTTLIYAPPDGESCGHATAVPPPAFPMTLCLLPLK